jgi:hypothetical protein
MLYREIIAVCSQIHTKHINTLCGQNVEWLNVQLAVHIASPGLQKSKQHYSNTNFFPSARYSPTQAWHTLVTHNRLYTIHLVDFRHPESLKDSFTTRQSTRVYCVSVWVHVGRQSAVSISLPTSNLLLCTSNVIKHAWLGLQRNSFAVELSNWLLLHLSTGNANSVNDSGDFACHRF